MPPKRIAVQPSRRGQQPKGYFSSIYHGLTSEENASVVISVALFGVSVVPRSQPQASRRHRCWHSIVFGLFSQKTPEFLGYRDRDSRPRVDAMFAGVWSMQGHASDCAAAVAFFNSDWSEILLPA
ncbi:hypothetical protein B0A52_10254 [Exophiala mesophila]|uniref:Uncharacterized protein n=1 Tax=Exophiala mesophila TaxID=212818 RepID=A0A438MQJ6_EXOME|nr:hypothetical protein B0A52_10254 [Exophiala mesophila]